MLQRVYLYIQKQKNQFMSYNNNFIPSSSYIEIEGEITKNRMVFLLVV